jgi:hypothetical protein
MDCDIYAIAKRGDAWGLDRNGEDLASGMDQRTAERAASAAARMSTRRGRTAAIVSLPASKGMSDAARAAVCEMARYSVLCRLAPRSVGLRDGNTTECFQEASGAAQEPVGGGAASRA